jgi:hypothetical protein
MSHRKQKKKQGKGVKDTTYTRGGIVKNVSAMEAVNARPIVLLVKVG